MANSKEPSAAQRREQARAQRTNTNQSTRNRRRRRDNNNPWLLIGGILVMVAVVIALFFLLKRQQDAAVSTGQDVALHTITSIDPKLLATVGTGTATNTMQAVKGAPPMLTGPTGKPQVFYVGGEYCPYCAAQRWAMIVALSRFGTFGPLQAITSAESSVPTFTFHNSTYTSTYIDFVARETDNNQAPPDQQPLDKLTPEEQQLFAKYDQPPYVASSSAGAIPFINIANQQVSAGAYYSPDVLIGKSYQVIADNIKNPNSDISRGMLGAANYLTAAICHATNNQPANVCTATPIPQIQKTLPQASITPGSTPLASVGRPYDMIVRRQD